MRRLQLLSLVIVIILSGFSSPVSAQQQSPAKAPTAASQPATASQIQVVPMPREVALDGKPFRVSASTPIILNSRNAKEDRTAAQMLADEIERATGRKPRVTVAATLPVGPAIYLTRTSDVAEKRKLEAAKLSSQSALDQEGYLLSATSGRVIVAGQTGAGLFYGVQTLRQLIHPDGKSATVPGVAIRDWPAIRWRGVHDDVSRGPIPTLEYMKKQVRTLAEYKINLFSIYMENVFAFKSNPLIAPAEGAITPAQMKDLIEYAQKYYVTILPEQQAFGHLHHAMKYEIYSDMAETPHGHVLAPVNPRSYEFVQQMYADLVPVFPSPLFHIGADETFELGRGQSADKAKEIGLGRVYLEHVQKVAQILKPYNKRLMFWADIAEHYPELLGILPKDMIPVPWAYDPRANFDKMLEPFRNAGFDIFVAPGANNWNRIYPNLDAAYVNIHNFVRDGQKFGAIGVLNTTWDDDGEALFDLTWPALIYGSAASWERGESSIEGFQQRFDWAFYRSDDHAFNDAVNNLSRSHKILRDAGFFGGAMDNAFWEDPFTQQGAANIKKAQAAAHEMRIDVEHALETIESRRGNTALHDWTLDEMAMAGWRLDTLGMKIQFVKEINDYYWDAYLNQQDRARVGRDLGQITSINARMQDLRDSVERCRALYEKAWLSESRPYWLGSVLVRYDNLGLLYQQKIQQVQSAQQTFRDTHALPAPETLGFYLKPDQPLAQPEPAPAAKPASPAQQPKPQTSGE